MVIDLHLPPTKYAEGAKQRDFYRQPPARVEAIPGVAASGLISALPLSKEGDASAFTYGRRSASASVRATGCYFRLVSPGYFKALGIALCQGRVFAEGEPRLRCFGPLTLSSGIGANSAILSPASGASLMPLHYRDPDLLAMVWRGNWQKALGTALYVRLAT